MKCYVIRIVTRVAVGNQRLAAVMMLDCIDPTVFITYLKVLLFVCFLNGIRRLVFIFFSILDESSSQGHSRTQVKVVHCRKGGFHSMMSIF